MSDISLVLFTTLSQLAVGAMVTLWILDSYKNRISEDTGKFIAGSLIGITLLSLIISLFHLGHPLGAVMAISGFGSSWISREVILFALFLILLVFYYLQWGKSAEARKSIGGITALVGVLAVIASGMIYALPAVPAWHNLSPVVFFLLTSALLGPLYVGGVVAMKGEEAEGLAPVVATIALIYAVGYGLYLSTLLSGSITQQLTGENIISSGLFWLRMTGSWLVPLALFLPVAVKRCQVSSSYLLMGLGAALIGELLGRGLFYSTVVMLQVGF